MLTNENIEQEEEIHQRQNIMRESLRMLPLLIKRISSTSCDHYIIKAQIDQ